MRGRTIVIAGAFALYGSAAVAAFDSQTLCEGSMRFYNEDGTFETYALRFEFEGPRYRIQATSESGDVEPTDDRGQCASYLGEGCRFSYQTDDGGEGYYDFSLSPRGGETYLYTETWSDGSPGTALVTCKPDGGALGN